MCEVPDEEPDEEPSGQIFAHGRCLCFYAISTLVLLSWAVRQAICALELGGQMPITVLSKIVIESATDSCTGAITQPSLFVCSLFARYLHISKQSVAQRLVYRRDLTAIALTRSLFARYSHNSKQSVAQTRALARLAPSPLGERWGAAVSRSCDDAIVTIGAFSTRNRAHGAICVFVGVGAHDRP